MVYATFIHNFKYTGQNGHISFFLNLKITLHNYFFIFISCVLFVVEAIKKRKLTFVDYILASLLFFNTLMALIINRYDHYFVVFVPVFFCILTAYVPEKPSLILKILLFACLIGYSLLDCKYVVDMLKENKTDASEYNEVITNLVKIPEGERSSVIGFDIHSKYYLFGEIIPCYKYFTFQSWQSKTEPKILSDMFKWMRTDNPTWVITNKNESNIELLEILDNGYVLNSKDSFLKYYHKK